MIDATNISGVGEVKWKTDIELEFEEGEKL